MIRNEQSISHWYEMNWVRKEQPHFIECVHSSRKGHCKQCNWILRKGAKLLELSIYSITYFEYNNLFRISRLDSEIDWQISALQLQNHWKEHFFAWLQHNYFRFVYIYNINWIEKSECVFFLSSLRLQTERKTHCTFNVQAIQLCLSHSFIQWKWLLPQQNKEISWKRRNKNATLNK